MAETGASRCPEMTQQDAETMGAVIGASDKIDTEAQNLTSHTSPGMQNTEAEIYLWWGYLVYRGSAFSPYLPSSPISAQQPSLCL